MNDLLKKKCVPCEGGITPFDISKIHKYQKKVDGWEVLKNDKKIFFLEKNFKFKNFIESQNFINQVGKVSEEEGHHPDIKFGWGYAKINIWMMSFFLRNFSNLIYKILTIFKIFKFKIFF